LPAGGRRRAAALAADAPVADVQRAAAQAQALADVNRHVVVAAGHCLVVAGRHRRPVGSLLHLPHDAHAARKDREGVRKIDGHDDLFFALVGCWREGERAEDCAEFGLVGNTLVEVAQDRCESSSRAIDFIFTSSCGI
jgi:hypothetical protein